MTQTTATQPIALPEGLLLECVVTTLDADGGTHLAPMGPIVDWPITRALLRPYQTSTTYANLKRMRQGILHITDDVELIARAALHLLEKPPTTIAGPGGLPILAGACRWYAIEVQSLDDSQERTEIDCIVTDQGTLRDFPGFNRAMFAVLEATITATRLKWIDAKTVRAEIARLTTLVEKTGSEREHRAFKLVSDYIQTKLQMGEES